MLGWKYNLVNDDDDDDGDDDDDEEEEEEEEGEEVGRSLFCKCVLVSRGHQKALLQRLSQGLC